MLLTRLTEIYNQKCNTPSDIYEHLPTLRKYAAQCLHVTEMGVRTVVSTYAILQGLSDKYIQDIAAYRRFDAITQLTPDNHKLPKLVSIDILNPDDMGGNLAETAEVAKEAGLDFKFILGSSLELEIEQTDMLFIDTFHIDSQLKTELERHHGKVNKYIALHDTTSFENTGEDGDKTVGLWKAVEEFLAAHPEWSILERYRNNNGFTILSVNR